MFPLVSLNCWRKVHNYDKEASVLSMGQRPVLAKESLLWMCWGGGGGGGTVLLGPMHMMAEEAHLVTGAALSHP